MSTDGGDIGLDEKDRLVPYHRYAFHNPYNYSILGGLGAAALLTQNWWLLILAAGIETLWMVFGPDSRLLQRTWFERVHQAHLEQEAAKQLAAKLAELPEQARHRVTRLYDRRDAILRLAAENTAFAGELLKGELKKLERLVSSFADLAVSAQRYESHLDSIDFHTLERDIARYQEMVEKADEERGELAQKNLAVLERRRDKLREIRAFIARAKAQMDLIENTFELLADQIVTMRSPRQLGGQLDELIDGVEAIRATARETDAILQAVAS